jgi:16S rRNA (uracil1498-N3)-methyltransferase
MTRHRWIADRALADRAYLAGKNAAHLARVLRARAGQEFEISIGDRVRLGRVTRVSDQEVEFELGEDLDTARDATSTALLLAIFKFDRMEWAIEKATELGAGDIVPVIARRTDPHLARAAAKRVERWRRIAHEAAQQSRRVTPPEIVDPMKLKEVLDYPAALKILLAESGASLKLKELLARPATSNQLPDTSPLSATALAVGPEGGWTGDELSAFASAGWQAASLGRNILRAETAAIAALAIVNAVS